MIIRLLLIKYHGGTLGCITASKAQIRNGMTHNLHQFDVGEVATKYFSQPSFIRIFKTVKYFHFMKLSLSENFPIFKFPDNFGDILRIHKCLNKKKFHKLLLIYLLLLGQ